jgi:hypothetical protein
MATEVSFIDLPILQGIQVEFALLKEALNLDNLYLLLNPSN